MYISKKIEELINQRILEEEKSSRLYLAMSKYLNFSGYFGASKLWKKYADEEMEHASWAYDYLEKLNILPTVPTLPAPIMEFDGLCDICSKSLDHEISITESCNDLAKVATIEFDFMTLELAQRYLKEQSEEVEKQTYWKDRILLFGEDKMMLRMLDEEMGSI